MRYSITNTTVQQVQRAGGTNIVEHKFTKIVFADLTDAQVAALRNMGCVVSTVSRVYTDITTPTPIEARPIYTPKQMLRAHGFEELRTILSPPLLGERFDIAVLDTGIRETHDLIAGRVLYRKNFTADPMRDGFDHGTGVASIIVATVPLCGLLDLKVLNDRGEGTEEEACAAVDLCISMHATDPQIAPMVINMSLGSVDDGNPDSPLRVACRAAIERGMWVIASAGNSGPNPGTIMSPSCERYVGSVGSAEYLPSQKSFVVSEFSSRGPTRQGITKPDAVMFGENIAVASSAGDRIIVGRSGTSFSAPFNSGFGALYAEGALRTAIAEMKIDPTEYVDVLDALIESGRPSAQQIFDVYLPLICIKPQGVPAEKDNDYGWGLKFGPLVMEALGARPQVGMDISQIIPSVFAMGMVGVMTKMMVPVLQKARAK